MLKIEKAEAFNLEGAFRGLRNPLDSWAKSDSKWEDNKYIIGPADMDLAHRMMKAGDADAKFLRQIGVCMDITAPLYWY